MPGKSRTSVKAISRNIARNGWGMFPNHFLVQEQIMNGKKHHHPPRPPNPKIHEDSDSVKATKREHGEKSYPQIYFSELLH